MACEGWDVLPIPNRFRFYYSNNLHPLSCVIFIIIADEFTIQKHEIQKMNVKYKEIDFYCQHDENP